MKLNTRIREFFKDSRNIYFFISFLGIAGFIVYAFIAGGYALDWVALENNPKLNFIDFFMHISNVADRHALYGPKTGQNPVFPPLAYSMYYFFYRVLYRGTEPPQDMFEAMNMPHAMFIFLYYSLFISFLLFLAIHFAGDSARSAKTDILLFCSLILSTPFFAGGIAQGNTCVLVLILLIFAMTFRDSSNAVLKETALILIAVSAGIKIYPAIFGLLYLLERRYKEAIRLIIYGAVLFFTPFLLFDGVSGFKLWLHNISSQSGLMEYGRIQFVRGLVYTLLKGITGEEYTLVADISPYVFLMLMLVLSVISKNRYRRIFFLCSVMTFFANYSYRYALCYLALPLVLYIKEAVRPDNDALHRIMMILYGLLFTIPVWWGVITGFESSVGTFTYIMTYVELYVYVVAYSLLLFMIVWEISSHVRHIKRQ